MWKRSVTYSNILFRTTYTKYKLPLIQNLKWASIQLLTVTRVGTYWQHMGASTPNTRTPMNLKLNQRILIMITIPNNLASSNLWQSAWMEITTLYPGSWTLHPAVILTECNTQSTNYSMETWELKHFWHSLVLATARPGEQRKEHLIHLLCWSSFAPLWLTCQQWCSLRSSYKIWPNQTLPEIHVACLITIDSAARSLL